MKSLKKELENSKSILVLLSKNPYLDQVAAGLGLYLALKDNYKTSIACPSPMLVEYNRLVGVNKIVTELGDKNLVIKFKDYHAQNIERVTYDIEDDEFRLTIIPKSDVDSPTGENIVINNAGGGKLDTVIMVGGGNESHFPDLNKDQLKNAKLIHVGKQDVASTSSRQIVDISKQAASVTEIAAELIKEFKEFDKDISTNLLAGLREGTRDFSHSYVNADTFKLASELMQAGGTQDISQQIKYKKVHNFPKPQNGGKPQENDFKKALEEVKKFDSIEEKSEQEQEKTPQSWLEPKIFKGTSKA